jgi:polyisoprenoid-binding protein YceI
MLKRLFLIGLVASATLPVAARATTWQMVPDKSTITITATQEGGSFTAVFKKFSADIKFDPADLAGSQVIATIDTASFDSNSGDRDGQVQGSDWFNVVKFPIARFATKSFKDLGGGKYEAAATLTIRDVSKDVVLPFTLSIMGNVAHMKGSLSLVRTDYGVGQGPWSSGDTVGKDVKVDVDLIANKAG